MDCKDAKLDIHSFCSEELFEIGVDCQVKLTHFFI